MGWKALKQAYGIEHIVCVTDGKICVGSSCVRDLVTIDSVTGCVRENKTFNGFLVKHYPSLASADPDAILELLGAEDTFTASIPVYTYEGAEIIERRCEALGWPNTTHDGFLMYENQYSADREVVIGWAKRIAELDAKHLREAIQRAQEQLADFQRRLEKSCADFERLEREHPSESREPADL